MQYSVPSHNSNCVSDAAATLHRSSRNTFRAQIAIHKLVLLLALAFLPLLAWHQSTGYLFEKISMPPGWEEMFKELQDLKQNTGLWVALWILAPFDILHALWCLGWYQESLHPGTGDTRVGERSKGSDENSSRTLTQTPTESKSDKASAKAHPHWFTKLAARYRRKRSWITRHNANKNQASIHPARTTPRSYHPFLQPVVAPSIQTLLLIAYDSTLTVVMVLHIYNFFHLIRPRETFCYTVHGLGGANHPRPPNQSPTEADPKVKLVIAWCKWINANITSAGGFASAVAALLAAAHVAALVCRLLEPCFIWVTSLQSKIGKKGASVEQDADTEWECSPRHVDIHGRHAPASGGPGRLTQISEEEYDAGGVARRRHYKSKSGESGMSKASSGKLENVLLECLVP